MAIRRELVYYRDVPERNDAFMWSSFSEPGNG